MRSREIESVDPGEIATALRRAGLSGAGGGGFPTYVKWQRIGEVEHLLVNHQESEPNCYVDKWLGKTYATELAELFEALLDSTLDTIVVGAKESNRDAWLRPLEEATDGTVSLPSELPMDVSEESGVVFAYTDDTYEYGMENLLLRTATGTMLGKDLPIDYGWIVQNTETLYNAYHALTHERPVLETFVHLDGCRADGSRLPHKLFRAPIGTSVATLLEAAGIDQDSLGDDRTLVGGGPGWGTKIQRPADRYGVQKHTNCVLLLDGTTVDDHTYGNDRVDVRDVLEWNPDDPATEPEPVDPHRVHIPTVTNETYGELIARSKPTVEFGDPVEYGQTVAEPAEERSGFSVVHHATLDGVVADVTPREVEIRTE